MVEWTNIKSIKIQWFWEKGLDNDVVRNGRFFYRRFNYLNIVSSGGDGFHFIPIYYVS